MNSGQDVQCSLMPYPSKTDRKAILAAAIQHLASDGLPELSLRSLAASLRIAPNAIYRYFADRAELEAAIAGESAERLHQALKHAVVKREPDQAIRSLARAYLKFARSQPRLYRAMMMPGSDCEAESPEHGELWTFVVEQVRRSTTQARSREAAVALWALLDGFVSLETAGVFGKEKPATGLEFGLRAWLAEAAAYNPTE